MIEKYLIGIIGITSLMFGWAIIQGLWRKSFPGQNIDEDVLAGRSDCGSCGCTSPCSVKKIKK